MQTRILYTKIWEDDFFCELTPSEKVVFIYYITNNAVNILHCYECPNRKVAFETGVSLDTIEKAKAKFTASGKMSFFSNYVYLANASKYETFTGEKNESAKAKIKSRMSHDVLDWYEAILDRGIDRGIYTPSIGARSQKSEIRSKKSEIRNQKGGDIENFLEVFNKVFNSQYRETVMRKKQLDSRLKTFTLDEIIQGVVEMSKNKFYTGENDRKWKADPDFFLRSDETIDKWVSKAPKQTKKVDISLEEALRMQRYAEGGEIE